MDTLTYQQIRWQRARDGNQHYDVEVERDAYITLLELEVKRLRGYAIGAPPPRCEQGSEPDRASLQTRPYKKAKLKAEVLADNWQSRCQQAQKGLGAPPDLGAK